MGDDPEEPDPPHVEAHAGLAEAVGITDEVTIAIGYGPDRPWFVKWQEAVRHYDDLTRAYDGTWDGQRDTSDFTRLVNDFCDSCFEVKNSLASDPTVPQAAKQAVEHYVNQTSSALALVGDVSNTDKHAGRDATKRVARVGSVSAEGGSRRVKMMVAYDGVTKDALDLATQALQDWRAFFTAHGISEP